MPTVPNSSLDCCYQTKLNSSKAFNKTWHPLFSIFLFLWHEVAWSISTPPWLRILVLPHGVTLQINNVQLVPKHIHTFPKDGCLVWSLPPPGISCLDSYFLLKIWAIKTSLLFGISIDHPWGGYGYFLEPHNQF